MPPQLPVEIICQIAELFDPLEEFSSITDVVYEGRTPHFDIAQLSLVSKAWNYAFAAINKRFYIDDGSFGTRLSFLHRCLREPSSVSKIRAVSVPIVEPCERDDQEYEADDEIIAVAESLNSRDGYTTHFREPNAIEREKPGSYASAIAALWLALLPNLQTLQLRLPYEGYSTLPHPVWQDCIMQLFRMAKADAKVLPMLRRVAISSRDGKHRESIKSDFSAHSMFRILPLRNLESLEMLVHHAQNLYSTRHMTLWKSPTGCGSRATMQHLRIKIDQRADVFCHHYLGAFERLKSIHIESYSMSRHGIERLRSYLHKWRESLEDVMVDCTSIVQREEHEFVPLWSQNITAMDFSMFPRLKHLQISRQLLLGWAEVLDVEDGTAEERYRAWVAKCAGIESGHEVDITADELARLDPMISTRPVHEIPPQLESLTLLKPFHTTHPPFPHPEGPVWLARIVGHIATRTPALCSVRVLERTW